MKNRFLVVGILSPLIILGLSAMLFRSLTTQNHSSNSQRISVTATFYPLAEFAQRIGGQHADVRNLTPAGVEPHDFEPTPQDRIQLEKSKVVVYNGASLEQWLERIKNDLTDPMLVNTSEGIPLLHAQEDEKEAGLPDPHVWLDPVLAQQQAAQIVRGLIHVNPTQQTLYLSNFSTLNQELQKLDEEFKHGLSNCESREIVTSHNAFQYLAKRYDLTVFSIAGLSPDEEPSAKKLAEVTEFVKRRSVKYIFFESLVSPKLAETIAQETGTKTLAFQPLEGLSSEEITAGKNYFSVQRQNLAALRTALRCQ